MTEKIVSAAAALKIAAKRDNGSPAGFEARADRSAPLSSISHGWAEEFNRQQTRQNLPTAEVSEMAAALEDYAVKAVRAEMLALARDLTARAKRLTAEDVRVLGNVTGSSVALFPAPADRPAPVKGGDKSSASASVRFTPDPAGSIGRALRAPKVAPRALPKVTGEK